MTFTTQLDSAGQIIPLSRILKKNRETNGKHCMETDDNSSGRRTTTVQARMVGVRTSCSRRAATPSASVKVATPRKDTSPSMLRKKTFSYRREWDGFRKGVDLAEKKDFLHYKTRKKTREVTSPGPWPLILNNKNFLLVFGFL